MNAIKVPIITVDGPSGAGKGTLCHLLSERLGWPTLDTGAIYRVLALAAERSGIGFDDIPALTELAGRLPLTFEQGRAYLDGDDVNDQIRTEKAGNAASKVAVIPAVRQALLDWQRAYARLPGLVADGRDTGTVVFPDAQVKVFLSASPEERAIRRYKQLKEKGLDVNVHNLAAEIRERDERDSSRNVAPLKAPAAALEVDSTGHSIEEVFGMVLERVKEAFPELDI